MSEKETKSKKDNNDSAIYFAIIYLPLMFMMFTLIGSSDSEDILTDEQKLEIQAERAMEKELKDKEWEESVTAYDETIDVIMKEAPFPINLLVGIPVLIVFFKGFGSMEVRRLGRLRHMDIYEWLTPNLLVPVMLGVVYVLWLSGDLVTLGLIK